MRHYATRQAPHFSDANQNTPGQSPMKTVPSIQPGHAYREFPIVVNEVLRCVGINKELVFPDADYARMWRIGSS